MAKEKKTTNIIFRVSPSEKKGIEQRAKAIGKSVASYLMTLDRIVQEGKGGKDAES